MNDEVEQIELSIQEAKKNVNKMQALLRLIDNKDFQVVLDDGYFRDEASRIVILKADPEMQKEEYQKQLDNSIIAIGGLRQYFRTVMQLGRMAERSISDDERTREELLAEEL